MGTIGSGRGLRGIGIRGTAVAVSVGLLVLGLNAPAAQADTAPPVGVPETVSADALPTWQINGVVWAQATVGNIVYVAGSFTQARPPGVPVGGAGSVDANNLFAYDITTGNRVASFNHQLNAQANSIAASPDGSTIYVGGDFTTVNGLSRQHIAAFSTATGALSSTFRPVIPGRVAAIAVSPTTVFAGGTFLSAAGQLRNRIAAFNASDGAILPWNPNLDSSVTSMVLAPDGSRVIAGGRFTTIGGSPAYGMGAIDVTTGASLPWAANERIRNATNTGSITSLRTDGKNIFGTGYAFGAGSSYEGIFSADPMTGTINWVNDCHGDTYDNFPIGDVVYVAGHTHSCEWIGGFKNSNPWTHRHSMAFSTAPSGQVNTGPDDYGWDYSGLPSSSILHWWPAMTIGSYTGQNQAGWSITGNSAYVAFGGEFPTVNGAAQQGLVRFAKTNIAPNKVGPVSNSLKPPSAISIEAGKVRLSWAAAWDRDNATLNYRVYRDNAATPFYTVDATSNFWQAPTMNVTDVGLAPGSTHTYKLRAYDQFGNFTGQVSAPVTVTTTSLGAYALGVINDGASSYWRFGEPSGSTAVDYAGFNNLTESGGVGAGATGAILDDADKAATFDGATGVASTTTEVPGPDVFTLETWIKTTTGSGGKIIGFGNQSSGDSGNYDRHLYMDDSGRITFGVYNGGVYTVKSPKPYNDGEYHHLVGTLSPAGMVLYIDGKKIGTNGGTTVGQGYAGYWRVGQDNLNGWPDQPASFFFNGTIDDTAVYPNALTLAQVQQHYADSGRTVAQPPKPTDAYGVAVYDLQPDMYWRMDDTTGSTAKDTSVSENDGILQNGFTLGESSPVSGATGSAIRFDGSGATSASSQQIAGPNVFTASAWFNTTTTNGGKIIGFGCAQFGTSGCYDRHIYMEGSGQLTFGVWTGFTNTTTSPAAYNDGQWHYVVGTQDGSGLKLYVDGALVGTNSQTDAQGYDGYWRIGGDNTWGPQPFFGGLIDEVAVWNSTALSSEQINSMYVASPAASNNLPTAGIVEPVACTDLTCTFDGSGSTDVGGTLAAYSWDFGDGTPAGTGPTPSHSYTDGGTYTVTLTVTDNQGATATASTSVTVVRPNSAPVAAIGTPACTYLECSFDGSGSTDSDGTIASYAWDFGDGSPVDTTANPSHTYAAAGTYTVTLTVTDDKGASSSMSVSAMPKDNVAPTAVIAAPVCTQLECSFNGSGSTDSDGTIASYAWDFGDGSPVDTTANPSHTYAAAGTYTVTLTVTDDKGASSSMSVSAMPKDNVAPTAVIAAPVCTQLECSFNGSGSTDSDGTIASYAWDFGDGSPVDTTANPSHAYAAAGTYTVTLTVTDNNGATSSTSVSAQPKDNVAPTAVIAAPSCTNLVCGLNGSGSSDPDGTIATYAWDFGDSTPGASGATPSHTFGAAGSYTVTLTVTDDDGASASATRQVTVTAAPTELALDAFARTVGTGWGTANLGGPWTTSAASAFSVAAGVGTMTFTGPGKGPAIYLGTVSSTNTEVQATVTTDKAATGTGIWANLVARRIAGQGEYRGRVHLLATGAVAVSLVRTNAAGAETILRSDVIQSGIGTTYTPGTQLRVRFQVTGTGTTTLRAKVWKVGSAEPAAWTATATDTTAGLQAPGAVGVTGYLSNSATNAPVVVRWDDVAALPLN